MICNLTIKNFKCFSNVDIAFKNLTLLTGVNGSGKSSVVQSLLLLRQSHFQSRLLDVGLSLNGELVSLGNTQDALFELADEDILSINLDVTDIGKSEWIFSADDKELDYLPIKETIDLNKDIYKTALFNSGFHYLKAERFGPRVVLPKDDFFVRKFRDVGNSGEFTSHFLEIFGAENIISKFTKHPSSDSLTILENAQSWLSEICPNTLLKTQTFLGTDFTSLRYASTLKDGVSNYYRATNVGFGISYTLPIIVSALSAKPGDILIVDTPEAHLHPRGQSKIAVLLAMAARSGVQVIIETHSDHILNGVRESIHNDTYDHNDVLIHYLSRDTTNSDFLTNLETLKIDKNGRLDHWPDGFFDQWDLSLQKLLSPKSKK